MFCDCQLLSDLKELENWNVPNGNVFSEMFINYISLSDLMLLQNWNENYFSDMFRDCRSLSDLKPLQN